VPDVFTKAKRSDVMSRIRSRGNARTELALVRLFRANGITGWRRHLEVRGQKDEGRRKAAVHTSHLPTHTFRVRPDFVFRRERVAVFVDGCFWHGCPQHETKPRNNAAFWRKKFAANKARDRLVNRTLRRSGWRVLRIWEHTLAKTRNAKRGARKGSTPHPVPLPGRGGEGERKAARLVARIKKALA
jgi:DNA mismatch endonuclease, patch repair protein